MLSPHRCPLHDACAAYEHEHNNPGHVVFLVQQVRPETLRGRPCVSVHLWFRVPDLRGDEADAPESTAKLVFLRDAGAQVFIIIIIIIIIILMMMMMMMLVIINNNNKKIQ